MEIKQIEILQNKLQECQKEIEILSNRISTNEHLVKAILLNANFASICLNILKDTAFYQPPENSKQPYNRALEVLDNIIDQKAFDAKITKKLQDIVSTGTSS